MKTDQVIIFDTTLRDGEQAAGAAMTYEDKLRVAELLDEMRVDVIEAGFPVSSEGDFAAVQEIARRTKHAIVCGLSRCVEVDIRRCWEAVKPAKKPRIHIFLSTSPIHREHKLQKSKEQVLEMIAKSVRLAKSLCNDVEWSAEDATRTEWDYLAECVETAIKAGATTINIPDTVGYALPEEFGRLIAYLKKTVPNMDQAILSVHCQNDLGLATANTIAGLQNGARQAECTINGIGERAGNTSLEEVVMSIKTRQDLLPLKTEFKTELIARASKLVSSVTGFAVPPNKAIVGANAFAHESGVHQDGMLKHAATYEIMTPESIGFTKSSLPLGKLSGRNAFRTKLEELGYSLMDNELNDAFTRFKAVADKKRHVYDEDLVALVDDEVARLHDRIKFNSLSVVAGSNGPQSAELELDIDGAVQSVKANGNGPVDATFNAIQALAPHEGVTLQLYQVHAVTEGTDAQAIVSVRLEDNGRTFNGQGADTDVLVASARAYLNALNRLLSLRTANARIV